MSDGKAPTTGAQTDSTTELSDPVREIEESFRLLIENVNDHGIFLMDVEGRIASWNIGVERLFGYSADEVIAQPFSRLFPSDQSQTADAELDRAKAEGRASNDGWLVRKNGTKRWCNGVTIARRDSEGKLIGFAEVVRDLTLERETGEALQDALAYANNIIATLREPFLILDRDLRVIRANDAFYRTFQVSEEETENRFIYELGNHQWDIPSLRVLLEKLLSNSDRVRDFEVEHTFPVLGQRSMLLNACRLESLNCDAKLILLAIEDIDVRRRAARKVEVSEVRYRRLFPGRTAQDAIPHPRQRYGQDHRRQPVYLRFVGLQPWTSCWGRELWEIGLFKDIEANRAAFRQLREHGYIRYEHLPLETKTGQSRAVEFVSNVYAVDGTNVIQCNIRDVTDRKRVEDAAPGRRSPQRKRVPGDAVPREGSAIRLRFPIRYAAETSRPDGGPGGGDCRSGVGDDRTSSRNPCPSRGRSPRREPHQSGEAQPPEAAGRRRDHRGPRDREQPTAH